MKTILEERPLWGSAITYYTQLSEGGAPVGFSVKFKSCVDYEKINAADEISEHDVQLKQCAGMCAELDNCQQFIYSQYSTFIHLYE